MLEFAKHDRAHCLAPGLFRLYDFKELIPRERDGKPIFATYKNGDIKMRTKTTSNGGIISEGIKLMRRPSNVIEYTYGDIILKFSAPEGLGPDDLRVLQGLIAFASANQLHLGPIEKSKTEYAKQLRQNMAITGSADDKDGLVVKNTLYCLAKEIGYAKPGGGTCMRQIRACIERLYGVSIIATNNVTRDSEGFRLLSQCKTEIDGDSLIVGLNPRIANAIIGASTGFTYIDLNEVRSIKGDGTRLIHQRLCAWIDRGHTRPVTLETVCSYIWKSKANKDNTHYQHLSRARQYLNELIHIGWKIEDYKKGHVRITRPQGDCMKPEPRR